MEYQIVPPPTSCRRCGSRMLDVEQFAVRDWGIFCRGCGDCWWSRRMVRPGASLAPKYALSEVKKAPPRKRAPLTVFGETKSPKAWEKDPRCPVTSATIERRLGEGWEAEAAVTTPAATSE